MKKLFLIVVVLLFAFVIAAITQVLPEPIQTQVNTAAGKLFPQKDALQKKQSDYVKSAEGL